jgi:hypothetical protein
MLGRLFVAAVVLVASGVLIAGKAHYGNVDLLMGLWFFGAIGLLYWVIKGGKKEQKE